MGLPLPVNSCLLQLEMMLMRAMIVNQNSKVVGLKTKTMTCKMLKSSLDLRDRIEAELSDNYL